MSTLTAELIISLVDRVTGPARNIAGRIGQLESAARRNAVAMNAARASMVDAVAIGYALARSIAAPVKSAMAFESAMADVRKVVDFETPEQFAQMGRDIIEMSRHIPMAADDIAKIVAAAGQAGMAGDELLDFAEMAAKVGVAFDVSAEVAGESLTYIKSALGMTVAETQALADAINHLSNTSAASAPDLLEFMVRAKSAGAVYGFTAEQTAAIGSAMIAAGAKADVSATSFQNVGRALSKGASATKAQRRAFQALGLDAEQVAKDLNEDAVGTLTKVIEKIRSLPEHVQASTISDLFGDEARALMPLVQNYELLEKALRSVRYESEYLGSSQREYEVRTRTAENAMQLLRNQFEALSISIGSALLPAIVRFGEAIGPVIAGLSDLAANNPQVTAWAIGLTASLVGLRIAAVAARYAFLFMKGGVLDAAIAATRAAGAIARAGARMKMAIAGAQALSLVGGGTMLSSTISGAISAMGGLMSIVSGIAAAIAGITAPVWGVIVAVIAAVAALALAIYNYWEPISNFVAGFVGVIWDALTALAQRIGGFAGEIAAAVGGWAKQKLIDFAEWIGIDPATVEAAIDFVVESFAAIPGAIMSALGNVAASVGAWFADIFTMNDYSDQAEAEFRSAGERAALAFLDFMVGLPGEIVSYFVGLGGQIIGAIGSIDYAVLLGNAAEMAGRLIGFFTGLGRDIIAAIGSIDYAALLGNAAEIPGRILAWFADLGGRIISAIGGIDFTSLIENPIDTIVAWFRSLPARIKAAIGSISLADLIDWPEPPAWLANLMGKVYPGGEGGPDAPARDISARVKAANDNAAGAVKNMLDGMDQLAAAANGAVPAPTPRPDGQRAPLVIDAPRPVPSPAPADRPRPAPAVAESAPIAVKIETPGADEAARALESVEVQIRQAAASLPAAAREAMAAYAAAIASEGQRAITHAREIAAQILAALNITATPRIDTSDFDRALAKAREVERVLRNLPGVRVTGGGGIDGKRAGGGDVREGGTYLVGEEGPELFTPDRDGYIHPAARTAAMLGNVERLMVPANMASPGVAVDPPRAAYAQGGGRAAQPAAQPAAVQNFHFGNIVVQNATNASPREIARQAGDEIARRVRETFTDGGS